MANDRDEADLEIAGQSLTFLGIGIPIFVAGSVGAAGAGLVLVGSALCSALSLKRIRRRVEVLEVQAKLSAGERYPEILELLDTSEDAALLRDLAFQALLISSTDSQAGAICRLLANGVLVPAAFPETEWGLRTIGAMSRIEMTSLVALYEVSTEPTPTPKSVLADIVSELEADAVVTTLSAKGLLIVDPPEFPGWAVSQFGKQLAGALLAQEP